MLAFHNDKKIKKEYLIRVVNHRKADEIIKGKYWENGKGCAVGCTIHSGNHADYEIQLGVPRILARLEDGIFESLPNKLAKTWPERFLKAIPVGKDLSKVWPKFAIWLLIDKEHGVLQYAKSDRSIKSINDVANLYLRSLKEPVSITEWRDAAAAAAYADAAAAADAADADDAAADAYADAAAYAAADADDAAADAAAAAAADREKARIAQSEKLLELLNE